MRYFLLVFREDWADEHYVPALACMTEENYKEWCQEILGDEVPGYDEALEAYKERKLKYDIELEASKRSQEEFSRLNPDFNYRAASNEKKQEFSTVFRSPNRPCLPKRCDSNIRAYLGNSGEGFGESFNTCLYGQDLVDQDYVKVTEVNENFYYYFNMANLSSLSLSNVFCPGG